MLDITTLLNAFPGYIAQGAIWGIMALGLYISYRLLMFVSMRYILGLMNMLYMLLMMPSNVLLYI